MTTNAQRLLIAVAVSSLLTLGTQQAEAADDTLVVTSYGGVWKESVDKNFGACFTERSGQEVAIQLGESAAWLNRIRANPENPPIHVVTMAQADTMRAIQDNLLETLDPSRVPHLDQIPEKFYEPWNSKAVDIHIGSLGIMYNKENIEEPPSDWKTIIENIIAGKYGKRVAWPSGTYSWGPDMIWFVAQIYDGSIDTAFEKLKAMAPYVVNFWTGPVEAENLFQSRQVDLMMYWDGRAFGFIDKGNDWADFYLPGPQSLGVTVAVAKVKNSPDYAWTYIDCALTPEVQLDHAETLRYAVTNPEVEYPADLVDKVSPLDKMMVLPYAEYLDQFPAWIERWNKEMR